ncbi:MAG: universal stress protein [Deltaproteobacteria bacterium]|nr:MAG: universal stress protein [Deltaproteobacteria bacterium]
MTTDTILVPVDYTGCAFEVAATASDIASRLGAEVVLLNVVKLPAGLPADTMIHPHGSAMAVKAIEYLDQDARDHLEPLTALFVDAGCKVRIALRHGETVDAILAAARDVGATMIIMGTHGRRGLRRLVEGSVAEAVMRRAEIPVVTIRTQAPESHPGLSPAQQQALEETTG